MYIDKSLTCCFTGHRSLPRTELEKIRDAVRAAIDKLRLEEGVNTFISGGALGFDMLATEEVIKAKSRHSQIKLILALPCEEHTKKWSDSAISKFRVLCGFADEIICLSRNYYKGCMHARNRFMLENSTYCICYCRKSEGGTHYTLTLAEKTGKTILRI